MTQAQRDWAKDFDELNKLVKTSKFNDVIVLTDSSNLFYLNLSSNSVKGWSSKRAAIAS